MTYRLHLKPYRRRFRQPLETHHGQWSVREGLLVGLEQSVIGWGEIAPLPWFGTETLAEAVSFCAQLPEALTQQDIFAIPDALPCCQFGFGSAWEALVESPMITSVPQMSGLLPAGERALSAWLTLWQKGFRTFKWKIGVKDIALDLELFQKLVSVLPEDARLRLDANGGLTQSQAQRWLDACDRTTKVEYLEQPLPPQSFDVMHELAQQYRTPLALDESVVTLQQLKQCDGRGWRGVMVVKPVIAGYPQDLRAFLQSHAMDTVFSSVFETEVGRGAALRLAQNCGTQRAAGFGVEDFLEADYGLATA